MPNTLTHSPAAIIRQLLIDLGQGVAATYAAGAYTGGAWPVFASGEPASPDNCITVYDTDGLSDGRSMIDGELLGHEGFQVRVRAQDHPTGWAKAAAIQTALAESVYQERVTLEGTVYLVACAARIGGVLALGKATPEDKRNVFTLNAVAAITNES